MALVQSGCKVTSMSAEASATLSTANSAGLPGNVQTPGNRHSILSQCGPVGYVPTFIIYILRSDLLSCYIEFNPGRLQSFHLNIILKILQVGPPSRLLIARCLTALFTVGDTFLLFDTINR